MAAAVHYLWYCCASKHPATKSSVWQARNCMLLVQEKEEEKRGAGKNFKALSPPLVPFLDGCLLSVALVLCKTGPTWTKINLKARDRTTLETSRAELKS